MKRTLQIAMLLGNLSRTNSLRHAGWRWASTYLTIRIKLVENLLHVAINLQFSAIHRDRFDKSTTNWDIFLSPPTSQLAEVCIKIEMAESKMAGGGQIQLYQPFPAKRLVDISQYIAYIQHGVVIWKICLSVFVEFLGKFEVMERGKGSSTRGKPKNQHFPSDLYVLGSKSGGGETSKRPIASGEWTCTN